MTFTLSPLGRYAIDKLRATLSPPGRYASDKLRANGVRFVLCQVIQKDLNPFRLSLSKPAVLLAIDMPYPLRGVALSPPGRYAIDKLRAHAIRAFLYKIHPIPCGQASRSTSVYDLLNRITPE